MPEYNIRLRDIPVGEHLADSKFPTLREAETAAVNSRCETVLTAASGQERCRMIWQRVFKSGTRLDEQGMPVDETIHLCWLHSGIWESHPSHQPLPTGGAPHGV